MICISAQYFYWQSSALHPLATVAAEDGLDAVCYSKLLHVQTVLKSILSEKIIPLRLCSERGWSLHAAIAAITEKIGKGLKIDMFQAYSITDGLRQFEIVLAAELSQMDMYYVSKKGCYSTVHLITDAEVMPPESIRPHFPKDATEDIRQGGKCLAFELPTAAAFHLLRATEGVLHGYFDVISIGKPRPKTRDMGKYIEALEKLDTVDDKVLGVLRQIKNLHRNPIGFVGYGRGADPNSNRQ